ncbi:hypothetical protein JS530_08950 [Bifidobacterium sp. LC6]|uniref:Uncharacterized protein n=1 Tax=Bifidobacterium colobi TaxID=2809026 RepID=A0ABS5UWW9_9BIFI|nr:hypothetical protein [Bifidobacterium colobi]MBT1175620.1 hypothetical protein [Bifidobacterium colobi]
MHTGGNTLIRVPLEDRFRRLTNCRHTSPDYAASVIRDVARMPLREYCAAAVALDIVVHPPQRKSEEGDADFASGVDGDFSDGDLADIDFDGLDLKDFDLDEHLNNQWTSFYDELKAAVEAIDTAGQEVTVSPDMSVASLARLLRGKLLRLDADNLWYTPAHSEPAGKIGEAVECLVRPLGLDPKASERRREHRKKNEQRWVGFTEPSQSKGGKAPRIPRIPRIPLEQRLRESLNKADRTSRLRSDNLLDSLRRLPLADYFEGCSLLVGVTTVARIRRVVLARTEQLDVPAFPLLGEASLIQTNAIDSYWTTEERNTTRPMGDGDADVNLAAIIAPLAKMADFRLA